MSVSIVKAVYDYILTCPLLKEYQPGIIKLNVDYSNGQQITTYSLSEIPCNPVLNEYVSGIQEKQFQFALFNVESFGEDADQNMLNLAFCEQFSKWIYENNKEGLFPEMDEGQEPTEIKMLTNGSLLDNQANMTAARYVVQCRLKYEE